MGHHNAISSDVRPSIAVCHSATYVSSTVRDLLRGGDQSFEDRGEHTLKGIAGAWRLYELAA